MAKKPETNVERVTYLMEHSRVGGLIQAFVITAIEKYAEQCLEAGAKTFDSAWMNGQAWITAAEDAKQWALKNYANAART